MRRLIPSRSWMGGSPGSRTSRPEDSEARGLRGRSGNSLGEREMTLFEILFFFRIFSFSPFLSFVERFVRLLPLVSGNSLGFCLIRRFRRKKFVGDLRSGALSFREEKIN